jgi:equilibrative nucleoside transporter 1/2/3
VKGVAGVAVGLIRIITKLAYGDTTVGINTSTLLYFLLAAGVETLCIVFYFVLIRTQFARYHMAKSERPIKGEGEGETESLLAGAGLAAKVSVKVVLKKVFLMGFTVWSVFFVTLSMFPGMTFVIPATASDFPHDAAWFAVINIFIFQVFDFIGRTLPRWLIIIRPRILWIFSVSRVAFGGLFILCIVPTGHPIFPSNWASFVIMALFALTNGYFGTLSMMFGPNCVEDNEKNIAGMIMSVFLQLGIFSAVLFALFILYLVAPCTLPAFLMPSYITCGDVTVCNITANASFI